MADRLRPESAEDGTGPSPLLPFRSDPDLGQELWRLDFSDELPAVLINSGVGDWKGFARGRHFRALVFPEIARQIARWLVRRWEDAVDDEDHAAAGWVKLFSSFGVDPPEVAGEGGDWDSAVEEWVNDAAAMFARRHGFLNSWLRLEEEDSTT